MHPRSLSPLLGVLVLTAPSFAQGPAVRLTDLTGPEEAWIPRHLTYLDGRLYLAADGGDEKGVELWAVDLTTGAVDLAADVNPDTSSFPAELTPVGGALYFTAEGAGTGRELWRYDPATGAATLAADIRPGGSSTPQHLTEADGRLFFSADRGDGLGRELWAYDPATETAALVADLTPFLRTMTPPPGSVHTDSRPEALVMYDETLHFCTRAPGNTGGGSMERVDLWRYDLEADTVAHLQWLPTGRFGGCEQPLDFADALYLVVRAETGTVASTRTLARFKQPGEPVELLAPLTRVPHANLGPSSEPVVPYDGRLYARAYAFDLTPTSPRLVAFDPVSDSLFTVRDTPSAEPPSSIAPLYGDMAVYGGALFTTFIGAEGDELWRYDATGAFTLAADVNPDGGSTPSELTPTPFGLAFMADGADGAGREVWLHTSDPVAAEPPGAEAPGLALSAPVPNPARRRATLTLSLDQPQRVRVAAYDVTGREVLRLHDGPALSGLRLTVPVGALPAGVYVVRAEAGRSVATRRLVVGR